MMDLGLALVPASARSRSRKKNQTETALKLANFGLSGVSQGFTASSLVTGYTATAGRYRLAPTGFVACAANEERLCYNPDGTFRGQYLQGADTYQSADWKSTSGVGHGSGDFAYLAGSSGGTVTYAGEHAEPDVFGGKGGGVMITQTTTANGFHVANNVKVTGVASGDILRSSAIVAISNATTTGQVSLGMHGGSTFFGFNFDHDASGIITGFTENWSGYRAGYHLIGTYGGKKWYFLWVDAKTTSASNVPVRIGFSGNTDSGKKYHVCELMIQKNPATAPAAVPVCAPNKTFAADTIITGFADSGYVCEGLKLARSQITGGAIVAPSVNIGVPYEPLETRIEIFAGVESADRSGILSNVNEGYYNRPWKSPAHHRIFYGPTYVPRKWERSGEVNSACTSLSVIPVFQARNDLRPVLGHHGSNEFGITDTLTVDKCTFLGVGEAVTKYWQQTDIRSASNVSWYLGAGKNVSAKGCLVMGSTLHTTRARHEVQADATAAKQVYVGEFSPALSSAGSIDISGTRFDRLGRVAVHASSASVAVALNLNDTCYDYIWSDPLYFSRGTFAGVQSSRRFHARITAVTDMAFYQSRKEIEVDTGSGYVPYSASGLALADLPHGHAASKVGTYDFDTSTFTAAPDPSRTQRVRYWYEGGGTSLPGYQWHSSQVDHGSYTAYAQQGEVYEIDTGTMKVRLYVDLGFYSSGQTWNAGTNPASLDTGTHADNEQVNRTDVTINGMSSDDVVLLNSGQGPFHTGQSGFPANGSAIYNVTNTRVICVLDGVFNMYRTEFSKQVASAETLTDSVFVQAHTPLRYGDGTSVTGWLYATGSNNVMNLDASVTVATSAATPVIATGGATLTGSPTHIQLPAVTGFDNWSTPGGSLTGLLAAGDIHPESGHAKPVTNPWNFAFAPSAAAQLGFDPNAVLALAKGNHARWDAFIAKQASVYFREPDHYARISNAAAVGTVVASGVNASAFHARYGGNGAGYFLIDGGDVKVAKSLAGVERIFVLRGGNDETFVVDVTA